jgi:hypothetical protein
MLAGSRMGDNDKGGAGLAPSIHAGLPRPGEALSGDAYGRNASLLNGNHVMGKPRRATPSMGGGADHSVYLCGYPGCLLCVDMVPAAERRAARPEVAPVSLEFYVGEPLAEALGYPFYGDIRAASHVVVQADSLAFQAGQAGGRGNLEINPVRSRGHNLQLHDVSSPD